MIETALEPLGCAGSARAVPHLTLARIGNQEIGGLHKAVEAMADQEFGNFEEPIFISISVSPVPEANRFIRSSRPIR